MATRPSSRRAQPGSAAPRVAVLVDTATSWGRRIHMGIHHHIHKHGPWQVFVEARGMEERLRVPPRWRGDGVIARVGGSAMALELKALRIPVVNICLLPFAPKATPFLTASLLDGWPSMPPEGRGLPQDHSGCGRIAEKPRLSRPLAGHRLPHARQFEGRAGRLATRPGQSRTCQVRVEY